MLLFKNKTKTISQIKINKKKSKILRNSIIAIGLSFIGFSFFAGMKIDNINNIISHNETYHHYILEKIKKLQECSPFNK